MSVGCYVEVKLRQQWDLEYPLTYRGIVIEREHKDLGAYFIIRQNVESYGYGVENFVFMYSPYVESIKVLSYQVIMWIGPLGSCGGIGRLLLFRSNTH